jgi:peptide-methionine (S)-S-oxide reductase
MIFQKSAVIPSSDKTLPGRAESMPVAKQHYVNGAPLKPPFPEDAEQAVFGLGCFWGAERCFWELDGVLTTAVGYAGGSTPNPTYQEVCSGMTGHTEAVLVIFDPRRISYAQLLKVFFESHDPTQGMRQSNDIGTQYRSAIYTGNEEQIDMARDTATRYQEALRNAGFAEITTEFARAGRFFYAEDYHQQYLAKNPGGYCGLDGTGVRCAWPASNAP